MDRVLPPNRDRAMVRKNKNISVMVDRWSVDSEERKTVSHPETLG